MPAERFYIDADLTGTLSLDGSEFHHLAHVMRIRVGEEIELINGRGALARAKVVEISKQNASLAILSSFQTPLAPSYLALAIPLMRLSKLELVVEKCTELGANAFWLYPAKYSEKEELSLHQLQRLQSIAISATKQCGRLDLPMVKTFSHFEKLFGAPYAYFFGDIRSDPQKVSYPEKTIFITGPEKGFSKEERHTLDRHVAQGVRIHKNILRAETAPIAAACIFSLI